LKKFLFKRFFENDLSLDKSLGVSPKEVNFPPGKLANPSFFRSLGVGQGIFAHQHRRDKGFLKPFSLLSAKKGERGLNQ